MEPEFTEAEELNKVIQKFKADVSFYDKLSLICYIKLILKCVTICILLFLGYCGNISNSIVLSGLYAITLPIFIFNYVQVLLANRLVKGYHDKGNLDLTYGRLVMEFKRQEKSKISSVDVTLERAVFFQPLFFLTFDIIVLIENVSCLMYAAYGGSYIALKLMSSLSVTLIVFVAEYVLLVTQLMVKQVEENNELSEKLYNLCLTISAKSNAKSKSAVQKDEPPNDDSNNNDQVGQDIF